MIIFSSNDKDIKLIGEGGNSRIYLLERDYNGFQSAAIKVPKALADHRVPKAIDNYNLLKQHGIKTTVFLDECLFDGVQALITENLHQEDFTYLDANSHLQTEKDKLLKSLGAGFGLERSEKDPEEERWFADNKFELITNFEGFVENYILFLRAVSDKHIYLAYDCYFFKVKRDKRTDIDYTIADWEDIQIYEHDDLFEKNKDQFKTALFQFVERFVEEGMAEKYKNYLEQL